MVENERSSPRSILRVLTLRTSGLAIGFSLVDNILFLSLL
jgi:hypothetical protein